MTAKSLGLRTGSYGSLQLPNGGIIHLQAGKSPFLARKLSTKMLQNSKEKERCISFMCCFYLGRRRVAMLIILLLALAVFVFGSYTVNKEATSPNIHQHISSFNIYGNQAAGDHKYSTYPRSRDKDQEIYNPGVENVRESDEKYGHPSLPATAGAVAISLQHPCANFTVPPPPPPGTRRLGPRPCPVCYLSVEQAMASMPKYPSAFPELQNLTYIHDQDPVNIEGHGGSIFGGYPSLQQRRDSFDVKGSMKVHCGFVQGSRPGRQSGFDIEDTDLDELENFHDIIVASAIFGNYDLIQQPRNISGAARKNIPFFMFVDEDTESYLKNTSSFSDSNRMVGLWRIIVVRNVPYSDSRRNGKVPKLLLHRIFPNVRYSIWIDAKLKLVVDPYQILERFLWRENFTFAISRHYRRFDVFEEAEANKAARKYNNASIDQQTEFYKREGLTPYTEAKLPITSDVPEGCVLIREHIPITNLFTCLWFNEVDRFTSRDQLSYAITRDKLQEKVNWNINMFWDCERRNFVIQGYHRDLLMNMRPPVTATTQQLDAPALGKQIVRTPTKKIRKDRKSGSKRHRKVATGSRDTDQMFH